MNLIDYRLLSPRDKVFADLLQHLLDNSEKQAKLLDELVAIMRRADEMYPDASDAELKPLG